MQRRALLAALLLAPIAGCGQTPGQPVLSSSTDQEVAQVQAYLNSIRTLQAHFLQVWPNGATTNGTLWMDRPGRLRLQYAAPSKLNLVAADGTLLLYDASTQGTTTMPLARTPLSILLGDTISLSGPVTVTRVQDGPEGLALTLIRTAAPHDGTLTLLLSRAPLTLHSIRMVDAEGRVTDLALLDLTPNNPVDPSLFQM